MLWVLKLKTVIQSNNWHPPKIYTFYTFSNLFAKFLPIVNTDAAEYKYVSLQEIWDLELLLSCNIYFYKENGFEEKAKSVLRNCILSYAVIYSVKKIDYLKNCKPFWQENSFSQKL